MPTYFKQGKIGSFIRQLNMFNFKQKRNIGTNGKIFKNPYFLRDKGELLYKIHNKKDENKNKAKRLDKVKIDEFRATIMEEAEELLERKC